MFNNAIDKLIDEHGIHVENLTRRQLADCIKQAVLSGDFLKQVHLSGTGESQAVIYLPYREVEQLRNRVRKLEQIIYDNIEGGINLL